MFRLSKLFPIQVYPVSSKLFVRERRRGERERKEKRKSERRPQEPREAISKRRIRHRLSYIRLKPSIRRRHGFESSPWFAIVTSLAFFLPSPLQGRREREKRIGEKFVRICGGSMDRWKGKREREELRGVTWREKGTGSSGDCNAGQSSGMGPSLFRNVCSARLKNARTLISRKHFHLDHARPSSIGTKPFFHRSTSLDTKPCVSNHFSFLPSPPFFSYPIIVFERCLIRRKRICRTSIKITTRKIRISGIELIIYFHFHMCNILLFFFYSIPTKFTFTAGIFG